MLTFEGALDESRSLNGGLGVVAYGVLKGLRLGGASDPELAEAERLVFKYFSKLTDEDCHVLCQVMFERLREEEGHWYA